mmetsp:Transcript_27885/g.42171  ORF Transcript_27885/g.42171 Transcript_27885/m.42171 type:complete len:122 (+) Transcript_27885:1337-1702(+)
MFITVVKEIYYFMILFSIFLLTFAETFHIVEVDIESYGRVPALLAHLISVLRLSMGDFSLINSTMGFDIRELRDDGEMFYFHSKEVMLFTFLLYICSIFFLFMIFMNFIIAVIGESYSKVI